MKRSLQNVALYVAIVAGIAVLFFFSPSKTPFYPPCLFHEATGLYCPGCGSTRALNHLLHGELLDALHANALAVVAVPVLGGLVLRQALRRRPPVAGARIWPIWIVLLVAVVATFGVLRNLPGRPFSWLAPPAEAVTDAK